MKKNKFKVATILKQYNFFIYFFATMLIFTFNDNLLATINQQSSGPKSPVIYSENGDVVVNYGITEINLAKELGVTTSALKSFFKILGQKQVPLEDLDNTLRQIANKYNELRLKFDTLKSDDNIVIDIKKEAEIALNSGEFEKAKDLLIMAYNYTMGLLFSEKADLALNTNNFNEARLYSLYAMSHFSLQKTKKKIAYDRFLNTTDYPLSLSFYTTNGHDILFSSDGKKIIYSSDEKIRVFDITSGKGDMVINAHKSQINSLSLSSDGKLLASGSANGNIKIWNILTGDKLFEFSAHSKLVTSLSFSFDGSMLASGSLDHKLKIWDITNKKEIFSTDYGDRVQRVVFSPTQNLVAFCGGSTVVKLLDIKDFSVKTIHGHNDFLMSVRFSHDGKILASGSNNGTVITWSVPELERLNHIEKHSNVVFDISFFPDSHVFATASMDGSIKVFSCVTGDVLATLTGHKWNVWRVSFSPNGKLLASLSGDSVIKLWDVSSHVKEINMLSWIWDTPQDNVKNAWDSWSLGHIFFKFSSDLRLAAYRFDYDKIAFIDAYKGNLVRNYTGYNGCSFISNNKIILWKIINYNDDTKKGIIEFQDVTNQQSIGKLIDYDIDLVMRNDYNRQKIGDKEYIVRYFDNSLKLWELKDNITLSVPTKIIHIEESIAHSYSNGDDIVKYYAAGMDESINIYDKNNELIEKLELNAYDMINTIVFSPNGNYLAIQKDSGELILFDIFKKTVIAKFNIKISFDNENIIVFTYDERFFAFTTSYDEITFYDIKKENEVATMKCIGKIHNFQFSKFDNSLVTETMIVKKHGGVMGGIECTDKSQVDLWDISFLYKEKSVNELIEEYETRYGLKLINLKFEGSEKEFYPPILPDDYLSE